ncbi:RND transporter [Lysobacter arseniciresistens ZS79]|uniref:RND transporter n=1 Tax=Lysobacter arseniciresistens ZS79 TaxID=913325 RepID=A0A0A0F404_9GAMM|nr:efflux RND transporter periplasmic adaptor subunit [Lysobacter arseniciresistens]KGM57093.1 RND transporter [Lysobacter arseniciresistens ZS79]
MPVSARRWLSLACLCLALAACGGDDAADDAATEASAGMAVTTAPVTRRELASGVTASGPITAVEEMQLGVELSGLRVTAVNVDEGEVVDAGDVLLTLDARTLDSDLAQARAALNEAEAGAALARSNLARGEQLARGQYISAASLDELRAARTQAEARVGTARAARDAAQLRRDFATLRAPADGVISARLVQPGQVVAAGSELLRLIRDGELEWRAELPAADLGTVNPGDRVELRDRDGDRVVGTVRAVSPGVDAASRTGTVFADLPEPADLQPGTYLEGRINTGLATVPVVPADAVVLRDGFPTVFVVEDGTARMVRIEPGARDNGFVEVRAGLDDGAQVVVRGAGFLADGDRVRVVPVDDAATPATPAPAP